MPPGADWLAAPDGAPSIAGAAMRLGLAVALMALAAGAWLWWKRRVKGPERHLEVIDRAFLARGASVALLRVGSKRLLVGVSNDGVRLIRDLGTPAAGDGERGFAEVLAETAGTGD